MRICVLGSGSGGNSTFIATGKTGILVDLGFGVRSLARRMREAGIPNHPIDAILITHGHIDHVSGVLAFASLRGIPVFMNDGTRQEVPLLGESCCCEHFQSNRSFCFKDVEIHPFSVSHDAEDPVGFRFEADGVTGAVGTDLGELSRSVLGRLERCNWLVLESNHDELLLKQGSYPWNVKQRVLGPRGHLSNQALSAFLSGDFDGHASDIFLAHLSRRNNDPEVALRQAAGAISARFRDRNSPTRLHLTHQSKPSIVLDL